MAELAKFIAKTGNMTELARFMYSKGGNMAELVKFLAKAGKHGRAGQIYSKGGQHGRAIQIYRQKRQTEGNLEKLGSSGTLWNKPGNAGQN
jgi:hypothetical protein